MRTHRNTWNANLQFSGVQSTTFLVLSSMFSFRSEGTNTAFELCSFACSRSSWSTLSSCLYLSNFSCKNLSSVWLAFKLSVGACSGLGLTTAQVLGSSRAMKRIRNWTNLSVFVDIFNGDRICPAILKNYAGWERPFKPLNNFLMPDSGGIYYHFLGITTSFWWIFDEFLSKNFL